MNVDLDTDDWFEKFRDYNLHDFVKSYQSSYDFVEWE